jgi:hypothetical protein
MFNSSILYRGKTCFVDLIFFGVRETNCPRIFYFSRKGELHLYIYHTKCGAGPQATRAMARGVEIPAAYILKFGPGCGPAQLSLPPSDEKKREARTLRTNPCTQRLGEQRRKRTPARHRRLLPQPRRPPPVQYFQGGRRRPFGLRFPPTSPHVPASSLRPGRPHPLPPEAFVARYSSFPKFSPFEL